MNKIYELLLSFENEVFNIYLGCYLFFETYFHLLVCLLIFVIHLFICLFYLFI